MTDAVAAVVPTMSIEDMLSSSDVEYRYIDMRPLGWKGRVRIGSLTAEDLIQWTETNDGPARRTAGLRLLIKSLVDDTGERIGRDNMLERFKGKSHRAIDAIVKEVLDLNGLVLKDGKEKPTDKAKND